MKKLTDTLIFPCGIKIKNRFMLAPLTNSQSHEDGQLSDEELHWLSLRAKGQFGITMTCASHVQANGKGFSGQLGIFSDEHILGHQRLTKAIQSHDSLAIIQLHHAGMRSPSDLIEGIPVCPSLQTDKVARALNLSEIEILRNDFIAAAVRAQKSGYDGVQLHGAHGYILCQFMSPSINKRKDKYGGSLKNRARIIFEILDGIREKCGSKFIVGIRLSPERFGMQLEEVKTICKWLIEDQQIDFIDISLWDSFKYPEEDTQQEQTLLSHFTAIDFKNILLTVAGKISTAKDVKKVLGTGVDFVSIGKSAILHHDFPAKVMNNPHFEPISLPVSKTHLKNEGLSARFIQYMQKWKGFVEEI